MKERLHALDAERRIGAGGSAEIVIDKRRIRHGNAARRHESLAECGRALIAETREGERRAATRRRAKRCKFRRRTIVHRGIEIVRICAQPVDARMICEDELLRFRIDVVRLRSRHRSFERPVAAAEDNARTVHPHARVPRNRHFGRCVGTELQMQSVNRRGRRRRARRVCDGRCSGIGCTGQRGGDRRQPGGGKQFAPTEQLVVRDACLHALRHCARRA